MQRDLSDWKRRIKVKKARHENLMGKPGRMACAEHRKTVSLCKVIPVLRYVAVVASMGLAAGRPTARVAF
jgi:hypothetical protein